MAIKDVSVGGKYELHAEEQDGGLVGWIYGYIFGRILTVGRIDVVPDHQGQGIGTQLWQMFMSLGRSHGAKEVTGQFDPDGGEDLLRYYERLGVEIDETGRLHQDL